MKILSLFTMIFFTFQPSYAEQSKEAEAAIVAAVNADLPLALASLETSVNINSGTMNFDGVKAVGAHFKAELEALGQSLAQGPNYTEGHPDAHAVQLIKDYLKRVLF